MVKSRKKTGGLGSRNCGRRSGRGGGGPDVGEGEEKIRGNWESGRSTAESAESNEDVVAGRGPVTAGSK